MAGAQNTRQLLKPSKAQPILTMQDNGASVYATQKTPLDQQVSAFLRDSAEGTVNFHVQSIIVPDSNLLSGGKVTAQVYRSLPRDPVRSVIVVSPSHAGDFDRIAVCSQETYASPLGEVPIDDALRNELCDEDDDIFVDDSGHFLPQGVEVQLPYLQQMFEDFSLVPLIMGKESPEFCKELGHAIGEIIYNRPALVVGCADIVEATPSGLERFRKYLTELDVRSMTILLNSEDEIRVTGKGAVLVAMMASTHRRADQVHITSLQAPSGEETGFVGALIGRR